MVAHYGGFQACFNTNTSDDRRARIADAKFPIRQDFLLKMKKRELAYILLSGTIGEGVMEKMWYPDGMIGFSHTVAQALYTLLNMSQLHMCEGLYLGLIAIVHKKDEQDLSDT